MYQSDNGDYKESTIRIELVDPCDPPLSITSQGLSNKVYKLGQNYQAYTVPAFTSDPAYCPIEYSYSETKFTDDSGSEASAIT